MKELFENNKKVFYGVIAGLCLVVGIAAVAAVLFLSGGETKTANKKTQERAVQAATDVTDSEEVTGEGIDIGEIDWEVADATTGALEVVEDSIYDVVEETPAPVTPEASVVPSGSASPSPSPSPSPSVSPAPGVNVDNMAQNVPFPYEIHVNKQMNCITVYAMDTSGAYSIPLKAMTCSTGNATPLGVYKTPAKYIWKVLKGNVWGQYSTRISGSILFHSVPYRTNRKDALISKYYNKLGTTASAGCVRLTTADAKWIYDNCPLGTTVVIYNDSNPGPLGKPTAMKVDLSNGWDPTDPDPANPWRNKVLRIEGATNITVEKGAAVNYLAGITAIDTAGNNITGNVQVTTNADLNKAGVYGIHYSVADGLGNTASADATLTVVDTQVPVFNSVPARIDGKKASEINRSMLLNGVSVTDNGQPLPAEQIEVQIPALRDGENTVTYVAKDATGNYATAYTVVYIDSKAPVITSKAESILELNQKMAMNEILNRISVQDSSSVNVNYNLTPKDWGYRIDYTVTDGCGNTAKYSEDVTYLTYEFTGEVCVMVDSIDNIQQLKNGLKLKDSKGRIINVPDNVQITTTPLSNASYNVTYTYTYSSPRGSKTAEFERVVVIAE